MMGIDVAEARMAWIEAVMLYAEGEHLAALQAEHSDLLYGILIFSGFQGD